MPHLPQATLAQDYVDERRKHHVVQEVREEVVGMSSTCTRCESTGFLNLHQVPERILNHFSDTWDHEIILKWIKDNEDEDHDVSICDCCGDMENWYGEPGEHNGLDYGKNGPYSYNGGLPECY